MTPRSADGNRDRPAGGQGLLGHLLRFGRRLRRAGVPVSPTQTVTLAAALEHVDLARRVDFKNAARALLVNRQGHLEVFDRLFDEFWSRGRGTRDGGLLTRRTRAGRSRVLGLAPEAGQGEARDIEGTDESTLFAYSRDEILRRKDFADLSPEEAGEVKRLLGEMVFEVGLRRTRRRTPAPKGRRLDLRQTLRASLRTRGETVRLARRRRRLKPRPLVLLCDVSASMEIYSRILLQLAYAVGGAHRSHRSQQGFEAFLFGTRLTRITRQLRHRDVDQALGAAAATARDWGGGTRIGETLKTFNYTWARRVLGRGAVVAIISDGWDRGDVELLDREMARLRRSCERLIWLNPLLGSAEYEPLTRGIRTALAYVDDFLPVHNLASLEQLAGVLAELPRRPTNEREKERLAHA